MRVERSIELKLKTNNKNKSINSNLTILMKSSYTQIILTLIN